MLVSPSATKRAFLDYGAERLRALCQAMGLGQPTTDLALRVFARMLSPWGERPIGDAPYWKSDVGDDSTPYEFSIALGGKLPEVRILVEAQAEKPTLQNLWDAAQDLSRCIESEFGADLSRAKEIEDLFVPKVPEALFSMWHAVSFWPGKAPEFKAYYNLQAQGPNRAAALLEEALCRLGYESSYPLVAQRILKRGPRLDELKYFSLDLASHERARVKLYARHHNATALDLEHIIGDAGGTAKGDLQNFCYRLLGTEGPFYGRPFASCLSLTDSPIPSGGTLYAPLAYYLPNDAIVKTRLSEYLKEQSLPHEAYERALEAFSRRPLEQGCGLHSYASFKRDGGAQKVTIYFAPEAYKVFSPGSLIKPAPKGEVSLLPTALVERYEQESIAEHPLFQRLKREPVDISKIWLLLANGREAISRDFPSWLAKLVVRVEDEKIRMILLKQLNDELGDGEPTRAHTTLFAQMLKNLSPWELPLKDGDLLPGKRMAEGLQELYTKRPPYEGIGASMLVEVYGKQCDVCVGDAFRRQRMIEPSSLSWLVLHEELEVDHANESMELARLTPSNGIALSEVQRGIETVAALTWRYFDELYPLLFPESPKSKVSAASEPAPKEDTPQAKSDAYFRALRRRFPIVQERAYFATHCLGPVHEDAFSDLEAYQRTWSLRSRTLDEWVERIDETRGLVEQVLRAPKGSVALGANATFCQAQLAASLSPKEGRNVILTTELDFPSSRYLWGAQAQRGFEVVTLASPDHISMPTEALLGALSEKVAIVAVSAVSYLNGAMLDFERVIEAAHSVGALVVLDAYQAIGAVPIDVTKLGVDALVAGSHKWLLGGGVGLGFLYVRPELAEQLTPVYPGWMGHAQASAYAGTFAPMPGARRFEQGTPAMEPIYTARSGLRFVIQATPEAIRERSVRLTERLVRGAKERGIPLQTPSAAKERGGTVCFGVEDPKSVVASFAQKKIDLDTRPGSGVRASAHPLNTEEECDLLLEELSALGRRA